MSTQLKINGVDVPQPQKMKVSYSDVDYNAGRTADGTMHRNKVATKAKLELSWPAMSIDKAKTILAALESESFYMSYLDPKSNAMRNNVLFYAGDRSAPIYTFNSGVGPLVESISVSLVEV